MHSIMQSGQGRLWWQRYGPRPDQRYRPLACHVAGGMSKPEGDVVAVRCSGDVGESQGAPGPVEGTLRARLGLVNQLIKARCPLDLQVLYGDCGHPGDRVHGWRRIQHLHDVRVTGRTLGNLSSLGDDPQAIMVDADFSARTTYEIEPLTWSRFEPGDLLTAALGLAVCDARTCGECGSPSEGCNQVYVLAAGDATTDLRPSVVYTESGGLRWSSAEITTLDPSETPNAITCVGPYLVVASAESGSLHVAERSALDTWTEVTTGFVAGHDPLAMWAQGAGDLWLVAEGGYVYHSRDMLAGVRVQAAGLLTTQNLQSVHFCDGLNGVAVGDGGAVVWTPNGGATWHLANPPSIGIDLAAVFCLAPAVWLVGSAGVIRLWYTLDRGQSWAELRLPDGGAAGDVTSISQSPDPAVLLVSATLASGAGRICRTIDGGATWHRTPTTLSLPATGGVAQVVACDVNRAWAAGSAGEVLHGVGYYADRPRLRPVSGPEIWVAEEDRIETFGTGGNLLRTIAQGSVDRLVLGHGANFGKAIGCYYDTDRWRIWTTQNGGLTSTSYDILVAAYPIGASSPWPTLAANSDLSVIVFGLGPDNVLDVTGWAKVLTSTDGGATWAYAQLPGPADWDIPGAPQGRTPYSMVYDGTAFYVGTGRHAIVTPLAATRSTDGLNFAYDLLTADTGDAAFQALAQHRSVAGLWLAKWASGTAPYIYQRNGGWAGLPAAGDLSDHEWYLLTLNMSGILIGVARLGVARQNYWSDDGGNTWTVIAAAQLPDAILAATAALTSNSRFYVVLESGTGLLHSNDGATWATLAALAAAPRTIAATQQQ